MNQSKFHQIRQLFSNGLWSNNPGFVQLLGLCPLLAISSTAVNSLGLGIATTVALMLSNGFVSLARHWIPAEIRLPVFVLIIASVVTALELVMNAYFHDLYRILGIFIPLIVTNCIIIGRAEAYASKNSVPYALLDGLAMGLGFALVLFILGSCREIIGKGTWMDQAQLLFGPDGQWLTMVIDRDYQGFLLAVLPPGAFIGLGLLLALKNTIDGYKKTSIGVRVIAQNPQPQAREPA